MNDGAAHRTTSNRNMFCFVERSPVWHLVRQLIRVLTFNRWTVPGFWKLILDRAEPSPPAARSTHRQPCRVFLYYHFLREIREAPALYGVRR